MSVRNLLHEEIESEFEELGKMQVGTEDYQKTVEGLTKLMDRAIEIDKVESDIHAKDETREIETQLKAKQLKNENQNNIVKNVLTGVSILSGAGLTIWGTLKSLKFEETGTVTTSAGRVFINKIIGFFKK